MHWSKMIIALKARRTLQVFDLGQRQKLNFAVMNADVVFWKWISETNIGLVTDTSVYHWDVFNPTPPVKIFDRNDNFTVRLFRQKC
jgi:clathrin heavy chain